MVLKYGEELQHWEIAVAKKLVGEFRSRSRRLEREEFDDLLQECLTHWIEVRGKLAPDLEGPPVAYMARVVRNKLTDMLREQGATKRGGDVGTVSLDAPVSESDGAPTFADLFDAATSSRRSACHRSQRCAHRHRQCATATDAAPAPLLHVAGRGRPFDQRWLRSGSESRAARSTRISSASERSLPITALETISRADPTLLERIPYS